MTLTLKNYTKALTKEQLQAAEKSKVRECDETEKGIFVAYVDEGSDSFDVSITLLPNGELANSSCDCPNSHALCRHKVALLLHVAKDKKVAGVPKIGKKGNTTETLLEQVEFTALKAWVNNLIQKNKDVELSFVSYFSAKKQYYAPNEVIKLINDALKAAGCSRKKADASQVKKLVELWGEVLQPVVQYYQLNVTDEKAFESFHTLVEQCLSLLPAISGVKILRYVEDVLKQSEIALNDLQQEESWLLAADHFMRYIPFPNGGRRIHYVLHLKNIIDAADEHKREQLISRLLEQFKKLSSEESMYGAMYAKMIFGLVKSYSPSLENYKIFKPLRYENEFNAELIGLLIENNELDLAKKYCKAQIAGNYQEQYNVSYLRFLKKIYTIENDEGNLAITLKGLFPWTFDFDAYLFITDRMEAEEKKKWRTWALSRARNAIRGYNYGALLFGFELMDHEKNYKKMIDYVDSYTTYAIILKYFEPMAAAGETKLLEAIIRKSDFGWHLYTDKVDNDSCFQELFNLFEKQYSADYLRMTIRQLEKNKYYYRPNRFIIYLRERLWE
ncbi:SWIM zinc finger family protein [Mucilaginibacter sp. X4EP1]|uniref:SWIM zinc finger family protein n=1 Tax=Mucilaginibacter sp. X4EP1 TaxID=2723092 RepID=UPI002167F51B|nr:SWIM zinc finger family protein [Mucilaginibacter sp. X4EP1]MCS3812377.1 hypothetical protein [Mucilaginibacter sp. X4EP1]